VNALERNSRTIMGEPSLTIGLRWGCVFEINAGTIVGREREQDLYCRRIEACHPVSIVLE